MYVTLEYTFTDYLLIHSQCNKTFILSLTSSVLLSAWVFANAEVAVVQ